MTECNKCGDCCEVIPFFLKKEDFANKRYKDYQNQYNQAFIIEHWHRISDHTRYEELFGVSPKNFLYTCDMFDKENRLCMAHDDRPNVCSDYPWYNKSVPNGDPYLSKNCSYWEDVSDEIREVAVAFKNVVK